jgi:norsolorinic acid ketoreductase
MQTDMGNTGAKHFGYEQAFIPVAESCKFTLGQIEAATRESVGGKFMSIDGGKELEW